MSSIDGVASPDSSWPDRAADRTETRLHPNYNVEKVAVVALEVATEQHPADLSADQLVQMVVWNPEDTQEIETAMLAIQNLREHGLLSDRDDEIAEPTPAALRAVELLGLSEVDGRTSRA